MSALAKYTHVLRINYVHHRATSLDIVDDAALVLIGNEDVAEKLGLMPRTSNVSTAIACSEANVGALAQPASVG